MNRKKFSGLLQWARRKGIEFLLGTNAPGIGVQAFTFTGGGTGTDTVTFADQYVQGDYAAKDMANTSYQVVLGYSATPAAKYASAKTTTGFTLNGLGAETIDVVVIGTISGMPDFTA